MKNLLHVTASEGLFNCRIKMYPDINGSWVAVQKMTSEKKIFNPYGLERSGEKSNVRYTETESNGTPERELGADTQERSVRRARARVLDLIRCNLSFRYFVTLTFDKEKVKRENYSDVVRCFSTWADNRVRRKGLKYVAVIERHKESDGLHFHLLCNDALHLAESGTVKVPDRKKPIKIATADKYRIPLGDRKTVFNIPEWKFGFSTAIKITGDDCLVKVSHYLQKYLTKDSEKVGGRYYYSGGDLINPRYNYCDDDFAGCEETYTIKVPGNTIKVLMI